MQHFLTAGVLLTIAFFVWTNLEALVGDGRTVKAEQQERRKSNYGEHAYLRDQNRKLEQALQSARESAVATPALPSTSPIASIASDTEGFAYVFYATNDVYACSVLVNINRLQHNLSTSIAIHVLTSTEVSKPYVTALQQSGVALHIQEPPPIKEGGNGYYKDCLLKLLAFKMHVLAPGLKRMLALDGDQLIMKNLDHLFAGLPANDLAAPRAYWLAKDFFASTFLMIDLSDRLWETVDKALQSIAYGDFDMDLINKLLGDTVMMLSGEYITLNSHWQDWNLPKWYHMQTDFDMSTAERLNRLLDEHKHDNDKVKRQEHFDPHPVKPLFPWATPDPDIFLPSLPPDVAIATPTNAESPLQTDAIATSVPEPAEKEPPKMPPLAVEPSPRFPLNHPLSQELYHLLDVAPVIHFTAMGKPWSHSPGFIETIAPDAHPLLAGLSRQWQELANAVCPTTFWPEESYHY